MKFKSLISALITGSLTLIPQLAYSQPIWVNLGYTEDNAQLWIDQQSIGKYKSTVIFDMKLETTKKQTFAKVAAECNTLTFQYQSLVVNNVFSLPPNGAAYPIQETQPDSVLGTAIYYACGTYQRSTF